MEILVLLILVFTVGLVMEIKRKSVITSLLFFLYLLSFVSTLYLVMRGLSESSLSNSAMTFLGSILLIWIFAFSRVKIGEGLVLNKNFYREKRLSKWLCIFLVPAFFYYSYYAIYLIVTVDNLSNVRHVIFEQGSFIPPNLLNTILSHLTPLFIFNIYFFYIGVLNKWSKKYIIANFIASLSFPALCLTAFGRDGILFWIFNMLICYILFNKFLSKKVKILLKRICLCVGGSLIFILIYITFQRFSNSSQPILDIFDNFASYLGQQSLNFSTRFNIDSSSIPENSFFPGLKYYLTGYKVDQDLTMSMYLQNNMIEQFNVFSFFVNHLYYSYGIVGSYVVSFVFFLIVFVLNMRKSNTCNFLLSYLLLQVPLYGIFYYRQSLGNMDISYFLAICLIVVFFKFK